ncbi:UNVERIFIED_CONTAM: hypothetical protein GTU68_036884 [Idotea baltica]|nr:hypothetical protein [Idotea baltica]
MIQIAIADDFPLIREGIKTLLKDELDIEVVGEANDGNELLEILEKTKIDVILLDISMPGKDGIETTPVVHDKYPEVAILILTGHNKAQYISKVLNRGASGYILKQNLEKDELVRAIRCVNNDEPYYSDEVTKIIMANMTKKKSTPDTFKLTKREKEVLRLIAKGYMNLEIAEKLFLDKSTIEQHRKNMLGKAKASLDLKNMIALVAYAIEHGWLEDETM